MRPVSTPVSHDDPASASLLGATRAPELEPSHDEDIEVDVLVVGAGASGLGTAAFYQAAQRAGTIPSASRLVVVEAASDPGGYCRTVVQDGFVFDYAGHFFHFRDPSIHAFVAERLAPGVLRRVDRRARVIDVDGCEVPFPYQAHITALPEEAARRCLVDLWHAEHRRTVPTTTTTTTSQTSFRRWLHDRLGRGLSERFLIPYNEKLYATDLDTLDAGCMGRFFPAVHFADVVDAAPKSWGYNTSFTYPVTGAVTYIDALRRDLDPTDLLLGEPVQVIDLAQQVATTTKRRIRYRHLVTSAPLPQTLAMCGLPVDPATWSWNRVLVFNLGFDAKGPLRGGSDGDTHWLYVARTDVPFYRVGFYDAITGADRLSLYVEVGLPATGPVDVPALRTACLAGLQRLGIVTSQRLISEHTVLMDPAYVHLTPRGMAATTTALATLKTHQVHSIGRYGAWTYCSIEDNLLQARALVDGPLRGVA